MHRIHRYGIAGGFLGATLIGGSFAVAVPAGLPVVNPPAQRLADQRSDRIAELQRIMPHLQHSIDILSMEGEDPKHHRDKALNEVRKARDEVQMEIDEMQGKKPGSDIKREHERDKNGKKTAPKSYYDGLVTVSQYLRNDQSTLSREGEDKNHHRKNALDAMKRGQKEVQAEMDEYAATHPEVRNRR